MEAAQDNDTSKLRQMEARLRQLEMEKSLIAAQRHDGFQDAVRLTKIEDEINLLEREILHARQRVTGNPG